MAAVGGARERPVGTRVGVVAASSDVIRLLPALCAGAPIAETSPCKFDAAFSGAFQGDSSTATTPVAFEVRRWKESHHRLLPAKTSVSWACARNLRHRLQLCCDA